jgi:CDP-glucose 4,6-dehydratase
LKKRVAIIAAIIVLLFAFALTACKNKKYYVEDCITTGELADMFCEAWGEGIKWENVCTNGPHEAKLLRLDCTKIKNTFDWKPLWNIKKAVEKTVEFSKAFMEGEPVSDLMDIQIKDFAAGKGK